MKSGCILFRWVVLLGVLFALSSCNKDGEVYSSDAAPKITLDSESHIYVAKMGQAFTVSPSVENGENASYVWMLDGEVISNAKILQWTIDTEGSYFFTLRVSNKAGEDEVEFRVDVGAKAPPVISIAIPSEGLNVLKDRVYVFAPDIQNAEEAEICWYLDDELVGNDLTYSFLKNEVGTYRLKITAENEDGADAKEFSVQVVDVMPMEVVFMRPTWFADPMVKTVSLGRTIYLRPYVNHVIDPQYSWSVDGVLQEGETGRMFAFTPKAEGTYEVTFQVTDTDGKEEYINRNISRSGIRETSVTLHVTCYGEESTLMKKTSGQADWNRVYEYLPAPGQFVNDELAAGFAKESSFEEAIAYAERRLTDGAYVSLGAFGGYIVVGFDHSIQNLGKHERYDFSIQGNMFSGGSEPGIVWVMQDVNGNGEPDDEWYELKGSEYGREGTIQEYAVTYYKPSGKGFSVAWVDNQNNTGRVEYLESFHKQDTYYPLWMADDSYTLYGTRLAPNGVEVGTQWDLRAYAWGYADNYGDDRLSDQENADAEAAKVFFKIDHAVNLDGSPANLQFIDFIKVQTGVNCNAGSVGDVSTEVMGFTDENLMSDSF